MEKEWKSGGCHCGAITWRAQLPPDIVVHECNCSICRKSGFLHVIVAKASFQLLTGDGSLTDYRFNTGAARHCFCKICGVKSFYIPRSNPDGVSLNFRCMDADQFQHVEFEHFDGQNWEENAGALAHLSKGDG